MKSAQKRRRRGATARAANGTRHLRISLQVTVLHRAALLYTEPMPSRCAARLFHPAHLDGNLPGRPAVVRALCTRPGCGGSRSQWGLVVPRRALCSPAPLARFSVAPTRRSLARLRHYGCNRSAVPPPPQRCSSAVLSRRQGVATACLGPSMYTSRQATPGDCCGRSAPSSTARCGGAGHACALAQPRATRRTGKQAKHRSNSLRH